MIYRIPGYLLLAHVISFTSFASLNEHKQSTPAPVSRFVSAVLQDIDTRGTSIVNGDRSVTTEHNGGGTWLPSDKAVIRYSNGNVVMHATALFVDLTTYNLQKLPVELNELVNGAPSMKILRTYSADGKLTTVLQQNWVNHQWINSYQMTKEYDGSGFLKKDNTSSWKDNTWSPSTQILYTTNAAGFVIQQIGQTYSMGQWLNSTRNTFSWDNSGNQLTRLSENWTSADWYPSLVDSSTYNENKIAETIEQIYSTNSWINILRTVYAYEPGGDLSTVDQYGWKGAQWSLNTRDAYATLTDPHIVLFSLNAGGTYFLNDSLTISWASSGVSAAKIQLSVDNGLSWSTVVNNFPDATPNFSVFRNWALSADQCLIRVSDASNASIYDQSTIPFSLSLEYSLLTHQTGTVQMSVFRTGHMGYTNGTLLGAGFSNGSNANPLYSAGVIAATASTGVYGAMASYNLNDLIVVGPLNGFSSNGSFDQISEESLTFPSEANELSHLIFHQRVLSKPGSEYIFCIYDILNTAKLTTAAGITVGFTADWDIGNVITNLGGIVPSKNLVYEYNEDGLIDPNYYGIVVLDKFQGGKVTVTSFNSTQRMLPWSWITTIASDNNVITGDYRSLVGSGPYDIPGLGRIQVGFALVRASSLANLELKADTLLAAWQSGLLDVQKHTEVLPAIYSLAQNYPNPFNPSTTIRFTLPRDSKVRLQIFNVLGQQVAELVNAELKAGNQEVVWDSRAASGIYFYRLEAAAVNDPGKRFIDSKKMLLLR